jgi:hypothetical protein
LIRNVEGRALAADKIIDVRERWLHDVEIPQFRNTKTGTLNAPCLGSAFAPRLPRSAGPCRKNIEIWPWDRHAIAP